MKVRQISHMLNIIHLQYSITNTTCLFLKTNNQVFNLKHKIFISQNHVKLMMDLHNVNNISEKNIDILFCIFIGCGYIYFIISLFHLQKSRLYQKMAIITITWNVMIIYCIILVYCICLSSLPMLPVSTKNCVDSVSRVFWSYAEGLGAQIDICR